MPIYEYHCQNCNHDFEILQKLNESGATLCSQCHSSEHVRRVISAAGFELKGTGWYATDFKNKPTTPTTKTTEQPKTSVTTEGSPA